MESKPKSSSTSLYNEVPVIQRLTSINSLIKSLQKNVEPAKSPHNKFSITNIRNKTSNKVEIALTTFLANNHVLDQIIDREKDSQEEIRLKKTIGAILAKPPDQR